MSGLHEIRLAVEEDAESIAGMLASLAEDMGDGAKFASTPAAIRQHGFGPKPLFHVMISPDAGLCLFFPHFSTTHGQPGVYVQDLWVAPEARRRSLGARLLAATSAYANQHWDARYMALTTHGHNKAARVFYGRLGFVGAGDDVAMTVTGADFVSLIRAEQAGVNGARKP